MSNSIGSNHVSIFLDFKGIRSLETVYNALLLIINSCTVWKIQNFFVTENLREIKVD